MKYSLISDMHVDHPQPKTPYDQLEELVVVAGDTANGLLGLKFIQKLKNKGHKVFAVDGNHEHYANDSQGRTIGSTEDAFYFGINQRNKEVIDGVTFLGVNGWYHVTDEPLWLSYMNDGRFAGDAATVNMNAGIHASWLHNELEKLEGKAVVVTHTAPCVDTLHSAFAGHYSNDWYWNPFMLEVLQKFSDKILVWNHGHTHASNDKIIHGVRVVCNPRGYPGENPNWKPLTVEVGS